MTELKWVLDTPDGFKIYGLLNTSDKQKNNKAILYIHGLYGKWSDYAATRMALTFAKQGYDIIRPNLYWGEDGGRSLFDCTIQTHAHDIDAIVKHFKKKYTKLFAAGHSYGGPSLMTSKINQFSAVSLWDPTYLPKVTIRPEDYIKAGQYYLSLNSATRVLGKDFIDEAQRFDHAHAVALSKKCKIPLQVIYANKNALWINYKESFHTHAKGPTDERVISKSQHAFFEEGSTEPLLRYTRNWFDQF